MKTIAIYARWQPIHNVLGRLDYLTSSERQENLLAVSGQTDTVFWERLSADAQWAWQKSGGKRKKTATSGEDEDKRACEAREIHIQLPKLVLDFTPAKRQEFLDKLVEFFGTEYGLECVAGLHLSKTDGNVHVHIMFSERLRLKEPLERVASRASFLDEKGFRKRTKKEILDDDGQIRPGCKIVPKGTVHTQYFGEKEPIFSDPAWCAACKQDIADWINETLAPDKRRVVFDPTGPYLAQEHIGKNVSGEKKRRIKNYNRAVKAFNRMIAEGAITKTLAHQTKTVVMLSPDRLSALTGALAGLLLENPKLREYWSAVREESLKKSVVVLTGGTRTKADSEAADKETLRALYRSAAQNRRLAKATEGLEREQYIAKARQCSMLIDRYRMDLGLYADGDYARRIKILNKDLEKAAKTVSCYRAGVLRADNRVRWQERSIQDMKKELIEIPVFFRTKEQKRREQQLTDLIKNAEKELDKLRDEAKSADLQYAYTRRLAKEEMKNLREQKKELKSARKRQKEVKREREAVSR